MKRKNREPMAARKATISRTNNDFDSLISASSNTSNGLFQAIRPVKALASGSSSNPESYELSHAPVVTSRNRKVPQDDSIAGSLLLTATDDGTVTHFRVKDSVGGGWFTLNGTKLKENTWFTITTANLSNLAYVANNKTTRKNFEINDVVSILAKDNTGLWSQQKNINVTSVQNANAPLVYTTEATLVNPDQVAIATLFSVRDEDNNTIKKYRFIDQSSASNSGYLVYDGVAVAPNTQLEIDAKDLSKLYFQSGADFLTDSIRVSAFDGRRWGSNTLQVKTISRPNLDAKPFTILDELERVSLDTLVSQSDSGPRVVYYEFYDGNPNDSNSAHFMLGNNELPGGQVYQIQAADLDNYDLRGGRYEQRSLDDIYVRAFNGTYYSTWEKMTVRTEPQYISSLAAGTWEGIITGQPLVMTYSFLQAVPDYYDGGATERDTFIALNATMRNNARKALQRFSDITNIHFVEVSDTEGGVIRFGTANLPDDVGAWAYFPGDSTPVNEGVAGDVWLNNDYWGSHNDPVEGNYGFFVLVHELGHALGLKHPFDGFPILSPATDSANYSVMSYTSHPNFTIQGFPVLYPSSPMLYDIAAIQSLYGVKTTHNIGDNTYSYSAATGTIFTIFDSGGTDTLDASNQIAFAAEIDLRPGSYSNIGQFFDSVNNIMRKSRNNIGIAFTTTIENAIGTGLNDTIAGNDVDNILSGMNGNDTITGRGGNDQMIGGNGNDTYRYYLADGSDIIDDSGTGLDVLELRNVVPAGSAGLDSFTSDLRFSKSGDDLVINLKIDGLYDYGKITLSRYGTASRIETLKLFNAAGTQIGNNIDLTSVFNLATSTEKAFVDSGVASGTGWGNLASFA